MTWAVIDTETTTVSTFKRKANPFDPANWIVMAGWCTKENTLPRGYRLGQHNQTHAWFTALLTPECKFIVGANIKFDLLHILRDPQVYAQWQAWVAGGGLVWDIQLAEYLLDGQVQSSHMLSLDDMALRYGCDTKVDEVRALWEAGVPTEDIDPALLSRYLLGEDLIDPLTKQPTGRRREGDIGNTRDIFLKQLDKARASGQSRSIIMNMGALLCTVEMERNGMFVDTKKGYELADALRGKLADAKVKLMQYLPADLPFEFSWTNRYHLSPLIFGGSIKYPRREFDLKAGGVAYELPPVGEGMYANKKGFKYVFGS